MFQPAQLNTPHRYCLVNDNSWTSNISELFRRASSLTIDTASLLSISGGGGFTYGRRTLFREITRLPWMTKEKPEGHYTPYVIPPHGFKRLSVDHIADRLFDLLCYEVKSFLHNVSEVTLLLSGGLDSRIAAMVLSHLLHKNDIETNVTCVTWGEPNSRDVIYGRATAKCLGFQWIHLDLQAKHLWENVVTAAEELGASTLPYHLHRMLWCRSLPQNSLVLAASYGDSIGRAEFSGLHLLELKKLRANNKYGLLLPSIVKQAIQQLNSELEAFHKGKEKLPEFALREHEMQGIYMRNGLSDAMSLIAKHCRFAQIFTSPEVYRFMWSIHPAFRTDEPYIKLLYKYGGPIADLPWARTNRTLKGTIQKTYGNLQKDFHSYRKWASVDLKEKMIKKIDPEWFAETGVFNPFEILKLRDNVLESSRGLLGPAGVLLWLASFRHLVEKLQSDGVKILFDSEEHLGKSSQNFFHQNSKTKIQEKFIQYLFLYLPYTEPAFRTARQWFRRLRRIFLRVKLLKKYPPK